MKIVAIIQARMGSERLPGKVLYQLGDKTVLAHIVDRLKQIRGLDVLVATTMLPQDDVIVNEANHHDIVVFRGSEQNVLSRYYEAACAAQAEIVIRITADCPFLDPVILQQMLDKFLKQNEMQQIDYLSNTLIRTMPRGLDAEIFTMNALKKAHQAARDPDELEHVTPYIYRNPEYFKLHAFVSEHTNLTHYRLTLDTPAAWELISEIYKRIRGKFNWQQIGCIQRVIDKEPALLKINSHIPQKQ